MYCELQARRIVVLHSPSGAGKSSLVQAGLIPRLQEEKFDVWTPIRVNLDPTGLDGVPEGTNRYLLSAMLSLEEELPQGRRRGPAELAGIDFGEYLHTRPRRKKQQGRPVVLLFDQLEEVLTVEPRALDAKRDFFIALGQALTDEAYWALLIIREDFLAAFAPYRDRIPTQMANTLRLDLLGLEGAREAAEQPALAGGREFPAVDKLIRDLSTVQVQQADGSFVAEQGVHVEPVQLQVVCRRLWGAMPADDLSIDEEDIAQYASVSESLAGYYAIAVSEAAGSDPGVERAIREWFGDQVIVGGIRSQVRQGPEQSGGLDNARIETLLGSYLVRAEHRAGANWFELSHDRLVGPIEQDNERWENEHLHPLQVHAKEWELGKRDPSLLLERDMLPEAVEWVEQYPQLVTDVEREFIARSSELRRQQVWSRRKRWLWGAGVATAVIVLGQAGWRHWNLRQRTEACETSGAQVEQVWNETRRRKVVEGLMATGTSQAATTAEKVMPWIDGQAEAWREARVDACLSAEVRDEWDEETYERALWCLEDGRMQLDVLVEDLMHADIQILHGAVAAAAGQELLGSCTDPEALALLPAPPSGDRPRVRALMVELVRLARLERSGSSEEALVLARQVLEQAETLGWAPLEIAARYRMGLAQASVGAYADAQRTLEQTYFDAAAVVPSLSFLAARELLRLVGYRQARYEEGLLWGRHAKVVLEAIPDGEDLGRAGLLSGVAEVYLELGAHRKALVAAERANALWEAALGPQHPVVARSLNNVGNIYNTIGAYDRARELYERALAVEKEALGAVHPHVAASYNNLAVVLQAMGKVDEAMEHSERALAMMKETRGPEHPDVAQCLHTMASIQGAAGATDEAKALYEQAIALKEKSLGTEHPRVADSLMGLGVIQRRIGAHAEAKDSYARVVSIREQALGSTHPYVAQGLQGLGLAQLASGEHEAARASLQRVLVITEEVLGHEHPLVASALGELARVDIRTGALERAQQRLSRALAISEQARGPEDPQTAELLVDLAELALAQLREANAISKAERALSVLTESDAAPSSIDRARFVLARALWDVGVDEGRDRPRAVALARQVRAARRDAEERDVDGEDVDAWLEEHVLER